MKPTLRQMEYLVAIAETGSFSEAAKRTHVSQPSLSTQVKDMEGHLGTPLLERSRQGAILTPIGEAVVARARIILRDVETMKLLTRESENSLVGQVRLGVLPSIGPYLLPLAVRTLHANYPELRIGVREERTIDLQTHLTDGRFDMIISTPEDHPDTQSLPLLTENLYACMAEDDPLAVSRDPITIAELQGRDLLSLGSGNKLTTIVRGIADRAGASVNAEYEGTSLDAIRQMSAMGGSVAILPSLYAISEAKKDAALIVRPIDHPLAKRPVSLIWRQSSPLADKFTKIGAVLAQTAKSIMAG